MKSTTHEMLTNGKMARMLGINPKTLRKWAKKDLVPSYVNRYNGYRYYFKQEAIRALKRQPAIQQRDLDRKSRKR